jgi:L-Ala-D/L-Glu epimerase
MRLNCRRVDWPFASVFRTASRTRTHAATVLAELHDHRSGLIGRGEGLGVSYRGETVDTLLAELASIAEGTLEDISRSRLQQRLRPGGARNALDCALWDIEAKRAGLRAWQLAGLESIRPVTTAYTLSLDTPAAMGRAATAAAGYGLLKVKLGGDEDLQRVAAVYEARPDAQLIVDVNEGWNERQLRELTPRLADLGVRLIEQPLPAGNDDALLDFESPIPLCADESCQTSDSLPAVAGKYQCINIKLDKTGGLTEGLRLARLARQMGLELMVGCMGGSSLSMAPAFVVAQLCDFVDLDAPLLTRSDLPEGILYEGSTMMAPQVALWG